MTVSVFAVQEGHVVPNLSHLTSPYVALHIIGGQIGLPIIIVTFLLAKNVNRHPTLVNFCITWIIYSVSYCLLIYSGVPRDGPASGHICLVQAAMCHGAPTMAVTAGLAVVYQIWSTFDDPRQPMSGKALWSRKLILMLVAPYAVFLAYCAAAAFLGAKYPGAVNGSNGLYCTFMMDPFRRYAVTVYCMVLMMVIVSLEVAIFLRYYRMWKTMRTLFPLAVRRADLSLCFRVAFFTIFSWATLTACIFFISNSDGPWPYFVQACLPLAATVIFGSQEDLFRTWCFWISAQKDLQQSSPTGDGFREGVLEDYLGNMTERQSIGVALPHLGLVGGD